MANTTTVCLNGIRRLWPSDQQALSAHFQRLDCETRRLRFAGFVSDQFVKDYAQTILTPGSAVFGAFPDRELRGIAELRGLSDGFSRTAELALVVEPDWQAKGLGEALFLRAIGAAHARQVRTLNMLCLPENNRMRTLARKHQASFELGHGTLEAALTLTQPSPLAFLERFFGTQRNHRPLNSLPRRHRPEWPA